MEIPLFSTIYSRKNIQEHCAFLRFTTHFFDFGQKPYKIILINGDGTKLKEKSMHADKPSVGRMLRIAAIVTGIIPLIMLTLLVIYRMNNRFSLERPPLFAFTPTFDFNPILPSTLTAPTFYMPREPSRPINWTAPSDGDISKLFRNCANFGITRNHTPNIDAPRSTSQNLTANQPMNRSINLLSFTVRPNNT